MAFHPLAIAAQDMTATHIFYAFYTFHTGAMGFELVKVEKARTGVEPKQP